MMGESPQTNSSSVKIHVTNMDSLDEFEGVSMVNNDYLPKLQSWINKKKYSCSENYNAGHMEHESVLSLQVDIFKFNLTRLEKSDMEKIKEEMEQLKHERLMLDREMKLFNFHFFSSMGKDNKFQNMNQQFGGFGVNQAQSHTIFSVDQLYHTIHGTGIVEVKENQAAPEQPFVANDHIMEPSAFSDEHSRSNLNHSVNPALFPD